MSPVGVFCDRHLRERQPAEWARQSGILGIETPRLFTPPLRKLTPRTSLGFEAIEFAEVMLGVELLPYQRWWLIHALELDANGDFRFRVIVTLISRQNGKTFLIKVLVLWALYMGRIRLALGAAQSLDTAMEAWTDACAMAQADPELRAEIDAIRQTNGQNQLRLLSGARYRITAATRGAGRGLSVDLLILDELREHRDWTSWAALSKTTMARPNALTVAISNAGDDASVVLNSLRERALGGQDPALALFEWSGADGCDLEDMGALAQANPALGHTLTLGALLSARSTDPPSVYRTEVLCQRVDARDEALDLAAWRDSKDRPGTLDALRDKVVAFVEVALDGAHVTLVVAALGGDDRLRVEIPVVDGKPAAWPSTEGARTGLAGILGRVKPRALGWLPTGPAAALGVAIRAAAAAAAVPLVELKGTQVSAACQQLADLVRAHRILHPDDVLLNAQVAGATKYFSGDGWRFARRGGLGHVDAVYAMAGAVDLALTLPVERPAVRSAVY